MVVGITVNNIVVGGGSCTRFSRRAFQGRHFMSVFVDIVRYDEDGPDGGNMEPITKADLQAAVKKLPGYQLHSEDDLLAVELGKLQAFAELEEGVLSCRYDMVEDGKALLKALWKLATKIPGAVVEDEEGNVL